MKDLVTVGGGEMVGLKDGDAVGGGVMVAVTVLVGDADLECEKLRLAVGGGVRVTDCDVLLVRLLVRECDLDAVSTAL